MSRNSSTCATAPTVSLQIIGLYQMGRSTWLTLACRSCPFDVAPYRFHIVIGFTY